MAVAVSSCSILNVSKGKLHLSKKINLDKGSMEKVENTTYTDEKESYVLNENHSSLTTIMEDELVISHVDIAKKPLIQKITKDLACDKILLKTGEEIEAKVEEIGINEIKYKKCDNINGPLISISKDDVFMITYSNGTKDVIKTSEKKTITENVFSSAGDNKDGELNALALTSFILGILGFIPALGIIFGIIAKIQIRKNPGKYRGETFATVGIILSILWWVFILLFLL
jgi:hypothetical protein